MSAPRLLSRGPLARRCIETKVRRPHLGRSLNCIRAQSTTSSSPAARTSTSSCSSPSPTTPTKAASEPPRPAEPQAQPIHSSAPPAGVATSKSAAVGGGGVAAKDVREGGGGGDAVASSPVSPVTAAGALPFWERLGPVTKAGQAYGRAQRARPWATQICTSLLIFFCGDVSAQYISAGGQEEQEDGTVAVTERKEHDWVRTGRTMLIGGAFSVPAYTWFKWLSESFNYKSKVLSIATRVAVNQCVWTPFFNVYFFGAQALLSGATPAEAWQRICDTVPLSLVNALKLWPAVTAFNFAFIPFEYRSVFAGTIAVGWQTYLSFLNGRAEKMEAQRRREAKGLVKSQSAGTASPSLAMAA